MEKVTQVLLNLINRQFACTCLLCECTLQGELLCSGCQLDLPYLYQQHTCNQCRLDIESLSNYCGHCLHQPPAFARSYIPYQYRYPLDNLILNFKYNRHLTSGKLLAGLLADYLRHCAQEDDSWQMPDLIIPAPMHWLRRWQRGFNQADILAFAAARELSIPVASRLIQRRQKTPAQKELTRDERQKNLRNAFYISPQNQRQIAGKRIALVDDVVTTTATVRELSKLLMTTGAIEVQVWALARTM